MLRRHRFPRLILAAVLALSLASVAGTALAFIGTLTVNDRGVLVNGDTGAVITGTIQCSPGEFAGVNVSMTQFVHGQSISGSFNGQQVLCDGTAQTWQIILNSSLGWKAGQATVQVDAYSSCYFFPCPPPVHTGATVHLRK